MSGFDVAVIGAGPAGAVASRVLALAGYRVILIDPGGAAAKIGESLPGAARPLLGALGLLADLERSNPQVCVGNMSAWGTADLRTHDFVFDPHGAGWHVDRACFDQALREAAIAAGVKWQRERLAQVSRVRGGWRLQMTQTAIQARWLIDASGRASILARRLGVKRIRDRELVAVYAWADDCCTMDRRTLIEPTSAGWWYHAPLPGGRCVAALHTRPGEAAGIQGSQQAWKQSLRSTRYLRERCHASQWSKPCACDASGSRLQHWGGDGWLAVGDAALTFDPLSSQGMFNALYTAMRGGQAVQGALQGEPQALLSYMATLQNVREAYLRQLDYYYRREARWANEAFWRARRA